MACCVVTAFFINQIIRALDTLDLKIIDIKYNDFDDPDYLQEKPTTSVQTTRLRLGGLTCAACVHNVEQAISKLDGVERVSVSLSLSRATVSHNGTRVTTVDLENAVQAAGYEATAGDRSAEETVAMLEHSEQMLHLRSAFKEAATIATIIFTLESTMRYVPLANIFRFDAILYTAQLALASYVQIYNARWIHRAAWARNGWRLAANMDTLISSSLILGMIVSIFNVALQGWWHAQTYFVTGCFLITVITAGRYLDLVLRRKSAANLASLYRLQNETVMVKLRYNNEYVPATLLRVDEEIVIEPMSLIPCDCYILEGSTLVDEATMTGEAVPVTKRVGDFLMSGTKNVSKPIVAVVTAEQDNSALARLTESISSATEETADKPMYASMLMDYFVVGILVIACTCFAATTVSALGSKTERINAAAQRAMAVLAAACPCAFGLASPSASAAGIDAAWVQGVIMMGGEKVLKALASTTHLVMDKTGTLTEGRLRVTEARMEDGIEAQLCHKLLYLAEKEAANHHPAGKAVFQWALGQLSVDEKSMLTDAKVTDRNTASGKGVSCIVNSLEDRRYHVRVGSLHFLQESNLYPPDSEIDRAMNSSLVYFTINDKYAGHIRLQDTIRTEAPVVIEQLKKDGLSISMLTGDTQEMATQVSNSLGIPVLSARSLPHEKQRWIKSLQNRGGNVAMVGDGVNDSLAQASADVGILLSLSRAAMTGAADVIVMSPNLQALPKLLEIAKMTIVQAQWNIRWAIGYNLVSVSLASGILKDYGLVIDASVAGMLMALSSLTILGMSLLLRRRLSYI